VSMESYPAAGTTSVDAVSTRASTSLGGGLAGSADTAGWHPVSSKTESWCRHARRTNGGLRATEPWLDLTEFTPVRILDSWRVPPSGASVPLDPSLRRRRSSGRSRDIPIGPHCLHFGEQ